MKWMATGMLYVISTSLEIVAHARKTRCELPEPSLIFCFNTFHYARNEPHALKEWWAVTVGCSDNVQGLRQ